MVSTKLANQVCPHLGNGFNKIQFSLLSHVGGWFHGGGETVDKLLAKKIWGQD